MRKSLLFAIFLFCLSANAGIYAESADNTAWPMYGYNSSGIRANIFDTTTAPSYVLVWQKETNGTYASEPIIAAGNVYIVINNDLMAYNLASGKLSWQIPSLQKILTPAYSQGKLYVLTEQGSLSCFDAANGDEFWNVELQERYTYPPLLTGDKLYVLSKNSSGINFKVISTANGKITWQKNFPHIISNSFVVNERIICFATLQEDGRTSLFSEVIALSVKNGEIVWRVKVPNSNTPVLNLGLAFVGASDGSFYTLDEQSGKTVWNTSIETDNNHYCVNNNYLYIQTKSGKIMCVDALTGKLYWSGICGGNSEYIFYVNGLVYYRSYLPLAARNMLSGEIYAQDSAAFDSVLPEDYSNQYSSNASAGCGYLVVLGKNGMAVFKNRKTKE